MSTGKQLHFFLISQTSLSYYVDVLYLKVKIEIKHPMATLLLTPLLHRLWITHPHPLLRLFPQFIESLSSQFDLPGTGLARFWYLEHCIKMCILLHLILRFLIWLVELFKIPTRDRFFRVALPGQTVAFTIVHDITFLFSAWLQPLLFNLTQLQLQIYGNHHFQGLWFFEKRVFLFELKKKFILWWRFLTYERLFFVWKGRLFGFGCRPPSRHPAQDVFGLNENYVVADVLLHSHRFESGIRALLHNPTFLLYILPQFVLNCSQSTPIRHLLLRGRVTRLFFVWRCVNYLNFFLKFDLSVLSHTHRLHGFMES